MSSIFITYSTVYFWVTTHLSIIQSSCQMCFEIFIFSSESINNNGLCTLSSNCNNSITSKKFLHSVMWIHDLCKALLGIPKLYLSLALVEENREIWFTLISVSLCLLLMYGGDTLAKGGILSKTYRKNLMLNWISLFQVILVPEQVNHHQWAFTCV